MSQNEQCELLLITNMLGLPPLAGRRPNSGELVAQISSAAHQGKLRKPIQEGRGATLCTALVHAAFKLIDPNTPRAEQSTLSRSVVLKALRDSEQVRTLLQLLQAIQQEAGVCLVFEKARLAIETECGSKSITLAEFEAHFVPAPKQRKLRPLGRLLTGLSLSVIQLMAVYVIAAHAGPTLAELRSALDLGAASAVQLGAGGGGAAAARASVYTDPHPNELPQWDADAVRAAAAELSSSWPRKGTQEKAKEEEEEKKSDDAAADPDGAAPLSWADGVTVGIKSDDAAAAAAAPASKDGPMHDGWSTKDGHHVPHTRLTSQEAAKKWAHDGAHSKRLLAEHKAKLAKAAAAAAAAATATAAKKGGKGAQEKATAKQKSAAAAAAAEPGADSLSWAEGGPLVPPPTSALREAQDARAAQAAQQTAEKAKAKAREHQEKEEAKKKSDDASAAAATAAAADPGGPPHPGGADSLSWSEAISAQDERAAADQKEELQKAKEERAKAQLQQLKAEKAEEKKQLLLLKEEAMLLKAEAKAQEEKAEAKEAKKKAKAKAKAEAMGWRWGGEGDGGDAKAKAEEARKDGKGTQETPATQATRQKAREEKTEKEVEEAKEEKEHQEILKEIQKDREIQKEEAKKGGKGTQQGRGGGAAGGSDTKEVPKPSRAEMAEHQNARKEKAKKGGAGPKSKEDMVRRFAEAAAEEEADLSREELTGRLKEVRSSTTPVTCAPRLIPVPTLIPTQPQPCPLGDGGGRHRQDAGDARKRAGLRRGGHGRDQGQG